jgi:uncharacterized protein (DUF2062 family)
LNERDSQPASQALHGTMMLRDFIRRRLFEPILTLLRQGITPEKIALSLAFGLGLGIFPVLGLPTILCTAAALSLRLNLATVQLVNYLAAPLQLVLIIPFVRLGEHLVHAAPQPLSISEGLKLIASGAVNAVIVLWGAIVHAALGWALAGPPFIYLLNLILKPLMVKAARNSRRARASARPEA